MQFFEEQARARRRTTLLVTLFAVTVATIVGAVTAIVAVFTGHDDPALAWWAGGATLILIVATSALRLRGLRHGGSRVAEALGGTPVPPDSTDLAHRRLRNVVEEMSIASGLPVPEIYVLENETGINAFAAGVDTTNAAVAVTRGALDRLARDELQGVIAHEFSHVLNGDMRLNTRLIGWLAGIEALAIIGRTLLISRRYSRHRISGRNQNVAAILMAGMVILIIGYAGLLGGRLIRAAVSRQREILADASAVQFTRQTSGLAGALKKILALNLGGEKRAEAGSALDSGECERVSHMLFAPGLRLARLMATHPPLPWRIRRLDPTFDASAFAGSAEAHSLMSAAATPEAAAAASGLAARAAPGDPVALDPQRFGERIGNPDTAEIDHAHTLLNALPERLGAAAHSPRDVGLALVACVIGLHDELRINAILRPRIGDAGLERLQRLRGDVAAMDVVSRLPLVEIALPALRRLPPSHLGNLRDVLDRLAEHGDVLGLNALVLLRVVTGYLDALGVVSPRGGHEASASNTDAIRDLLALLAAHGHPDPADAEQAYHAGLARLTDSHQSLPYAPPAAPANALDAALARLRSLPEQRKESLVVAIAATATHDGVVTTEEAEMVRGVCAVIGVPVPPLLATAASGSD